MSEENAKPPAVGEVWEALKTALRQWENFSDEQRDGLSNFDWLASADDHEGHLYRRCVSVAERLEAVADGSPDAPIVDSDRVRLQRVVGRHDDDLRTEADRAATEWQANRNYIGTANRVTERERAIYEAGYLAGRRAHGEVPPIDDSTPDGSITNRESTP